MFLSLNLLLINTMRHGHWTSRKKCLENDINTKNSGLIKSLYIDFHATVSRLERVFFFLTALRYNCTRPEYSYSKKGISKKVRKITSRGLRPNFIEKYYLNETFPCIVGKFLTKEFPFLQDNFFISFLRSRACQVCQKTEVNLMTQAFEAKQISYILFQIFFSGRKGWG
jgi:hypothetical protein